MEYIKYIGVGDNGNTICWDTIASSVFQCKANIYEKLYKPLGDKPDWAQWEIRQVIIIFQE